MITRENYGEEHIRQLQLQSRKDPQLIERASVIFPFVRYEEQVRVACLS